MWLLVMLMLHHLATLCLLLAHQPHQLAPLRWLLALQPSHHLVLLSLWHLDQVVLVAS